MVRGDDRPGGAGPEQAAAPSAGRRAHARLFAVLVVTMAASTLMQFTLGVLGPYITEEFDLTRAAFGTAGSTVCLSGLVVSLLAGRLVDRWGVPWLIPALHVSVVTGLVVVAAAPHWAWVLAAAVVMGIPLGLGNPVTNILIVDRVDYGVQGTATGIKQSGVQLGALVAGAVVPPVALAHGWRLAVGLLAVVALAGLVVSVVLREARERGAGRSRFVGGQPSGRPSKLALFLGAYAVLMGCGASAVIGFIPLYAHQELGLTASQAGQLMAVVGLVGAASRAAMGVAGNGVRRFEPWLAVLATVAACAVGLLFAAPSRPSLVWLAVVGLGASAIAWQTPAMLAVVREGRNAARSSGVVMTGFLAGMMIGPLAFGSLVDATEEYAAGWVLVATIFGTAALLSLVFAATGARGGAARS